MKEYGEILNSFLVRLAMAVVPFAIGWWIMSTGNEAGALFGVVFVTMAGALICWPVGRFVAEFLFNALFSTQHFEVPQPAYSIPEAKRKRGLHLEALEGFQRISREHPDLLRPYLEMIDIAVMDLKDPALAQAFLKRGLSSLKKEEDRRELKTTYDLIRSRLHPPSR